MSFSAHIVGEKFPTVVEVHRFRDAEPQNAVPQCQDRGLGIRRFRNVPAGDHAGFGIQKCRQIQAVNGAVFVQRLNIQRVVVGNPYVIRFQLVIHSDNVRHTAVRKRLFALTHQNFRCLCHIVVDSPPKASLRWDTSHQLRVEILCPADHIAIAGSDSWLILVQPEPQKRLPHDLGNAAAVLVPAAPYSQHTGEIMLLIGVPFAVQNPRGNL